MIGKILNFVVAMTFFLSGLGALAEERPRFLIFKQPIVNIDTVRFDVGNIELKFECVNVSKDTVYIVDVHSQCSCLTGDFPRKAIMPGTTSEIKAQLKVDNLFAEQKRYLTVIATNGKYRKFNTIGVSGYVQRDQSEADIRYPHVLMPGLRSDVSVVGMRLSKEGETSEKIFHIYNESSQLMTLKWQTQKDVYAESKLIINPSEKIEVKIRVNTTGFPKGIYERKLYGLINNGKEFIIQLKGAVE